MTKKSYYSNRYKTKNIENLLDTTNLQSCYFLGLLYADGYISNLEKAIGISLIEQDSYILEELTSLINIPKTAIKQRKIGALNKRKQVQLHICSKDLIKKLVPFGIIRNKSKIGAIPSLPSNLQSKLAFLRGWIDGDGCVGKQIFITMANEEQVKFCIDLLKEIGVNAKFSRTGKDKKYFNVRINTSNYNKMKDVFSLPIKSLTRKTDKFFSYYNSKMKQ